MTMAPWQHYYSNVATVLFLAAYIPAQAAQIYSLSSTLVPSDEPQGFMATVLGPVSIFLQWNSPTMPNGILTNYILRYSNSTDVVDVVLGGTATDFTADYLNQATTYFFQLNASTMVGYGPAASANATTDEDGKTAVFCL